MQRFRYLVSSCEKYVWTRWLVRILVNRLSRVIRYTHSRVPALISDLRKLQKWTSSGLSRFTAQLTFARNHWPLKYTIGVCVCVGCARIRAIIMQVLAYSREWHSVHKFFLKLNFKETNRLLFIFRITFFDMRLFYYKYFNAIPLSSAW